MQTMPIDPLTQSAIVTALATALATGAAFAGTETAKLVIKDAYAKVKSYLGRKEPALDLSALEAAPDSAAARAALGAQLAHSAVLQDPQVYILIDKLLLAVQQNAPDAAVDIGAMRRSLVTIGNVNVEGGTGLRTGDIEDSTFTIGDITSKK
jgi:hypothetical protein